VEDANFVFDMADAGMLRLHTFLKWVEEMVVLRDKGEFRSAKDGNTFADRVFDNEMNSLIQRTGESYENTLYKEALKTGFFEYQTARDNYKQLCNGKDSEMQADLVFRFIETQALILSPICPHVCERIWQTIAKKTLIVQEKWPSTKAVDHILLKESEFLHRTIREFRLRKELVLNPKKKASQKQKQDQSTPTGPVSAVVYVANKYPEWKINVMKILKEHYEKNGKKFPDNRAIAQQLSKYGKEAMPFVQVVREKFETGSKSDFAVQETSEFDQNRVYEDVRDYFLSTLGLAGVTFVDTSDPSVPTEIVKSCSPGSPFIHYSVGENK